MKKGNLFAGIPQSVPDEIFETIVESREVKIERIISKGQASPKNFWYNQDKNEWVIVLRGFAKIRFESDELIVLSAGDYINIPAHKKHRVEYTDTETETIWLAVFY